MPKRGYILIADITGYTAYLADTELEHARETLQELLNTILEHIEPPLKVSKLEGDAVLAYTPAENTLQGQTLVDMVERIYAGFRKALGLMVINTTCKCAACENIGTLDLKFFVHHGEFMEQQIGSFVELVGTDVNLLHRLVKNSVNEKLKVFAYCMYTQAAVGSAGLENLSARMNTHEENIEHIGTVKTYVQDMHEVWSRLRKDLNMAVAPDAAIVEVVEHVPWPPMVAWEYLTQPETRGVLTGADSTTLDLNAEGRLAEGAVYHCAHGSNHTEFIIVEWQPFEQYTIRHGAPFGTEALNTFELEPLDGGTRVHIRIARPQGGLIGTVLANIVTRLFFPRILRRGITKLLAHVEANPPAQLPAPAE